MKRLAALLALLVPLPFAACGRGPRDVVDAMLDEAVAGRRVDDFWASEPTMGFSNMQRYEYAETVSDASLDLEKLEKSIKAKEQALPVLERRRSEATEKGLRGDSAAMSSVRRFDAALAALQADIEADKQHKLELIDKLHDPPMWLRYSLFTASGAGTRREDCYFKVEEVRGEHRVTGARSVEAAAPQARPEELADQWFNRIPP